MGLKELVFGTPYSDKAWVPENAFGYTDLSSGNHEFGTFVSGGERFAFVRTVSNPDHSQYLVGWYEGNESSTKQSLIESLSTSDRQVIHVFFDRGEDGPRTVHSNFVYGVRYCKPCLVCSKELETVDSTSDKVVEQPSGGTNFSTRGHYGSTVFDPYSNELLSINICDDCLKLKARQGLITHVKERHRVVDESEQTDWAPQG